MNAAPAALRAAQHVERILAAEPVTVQRCLVAIAAASALHGAALGASSGEWALALFSAVKVPVLLLASCAVTLPFFFVLHATLGLRPADFAIACRGVIAAQAALAIVLGATAPLVVFAALSIHNDYLLTLFDGALFALAVFGAQIVLRRHYGPLLARDPRHRVPLAGWALLYAFFAIQLAWVLRPFLGTPGYPVEFFRATAFEQNAYVVLFEHFARLFRG